MKLIDHFTTITNHKRLVMEHCFKCGLYWQGITHDLSKYSPTEFIRGVKYFQGNKSPNEAERIDTGVSRAWLHHKGRNKHHFEYWTDYDITPENKGNMTGMLMPEKYVCEMVCDRMAASKIYMKEAYTDHAPLAYFERSKNHYMMHPETMKLLHKLLVILDERGEDYLFAYMKKKILHK